MTRLESAAAALLELYDEIVNSQDGMTYENAYGLLKAYKLWGELRAALPPNEP